MKTARIAVPDLVSNSYFPAIAAITLDCFKQEGLHAVHELIFPNYKAYEALRDGKVDFVAAPAHAALLAFPEWSGAKMLVALSQGMFWLLVMRSDLGATPGDIGAVKGRTIGAAPLVSLGLQQMLIDWNSIWNVMPYGSSGFRARTSRASLSASWRPKHSSTDRSTVSGRMRWGPKRDSERCRQGRA